MLTPSVDPMLEHIKCLAVCNFTYILCSKNSMSNMFIGEVNEQTHTKMVKLVMTYEAFLLFYIVIV